MLAQVFKLFHGVFVLVVIALVLSNIMDLSFLANLFTFKFL